MFGFGGNPLKDANEMKNFVDAINSYEKKGKVPPEEFLDVIMQVNAADFVGAGGEDFAENIQNIQRNYMHMERYARSADKLSHLQ
tara:strand:- start:269 stop:523 length:255 start_codon:yes stop_codon:yes gene_type:complete